MKITFLIDYSAAFGGGDYAQFKFAEYLAKKGHKITILTTKKNFITKQLKNKKNITIKYRPELKVIIKKIGIGRINKLLKNIYLKKSLIPFLKKNKQDWIIGYLRDPAITATKLGKELNIKVANFIFESPPWMKEQLGEKWDEELKNKRFKNSWELTKEAYENSNVLIPNSKLSGKKCKEWISKANISEPVYPGVELNKNKLDKNQKNDSLKEYDLVYVGRLNELKNIDDLLNATKMLKDKGIELKTAIMGVGEEEKKLKELSKELNLNINFLGEVTDEEKFSVLKNSRILAFPTSFEGFGMPPLEGLMSGCKVICSNIPILKEIYSNNVTYFELNNIKDLAEKIKKELTNKKSNAKINDLLKKYNWTTSANKIEKILKENS